MEKELELRKYIFVPYNISDIQKGIQAGHASDIYGQLFKDDDENILFVDNHKTWIVLDGGTTCDGDTEEERGTMNNILESLETSTLGIKFTSFREHDLNRALTAICFIVDERVFDYDLYPDFKEYFLNEKSVYGRYSRPRDSKLPYETLKRNFPKTFDKWTETLGGKKNVFFRELLKGKKLA